MPFKYIFKKHQLAQEKAFLVAVENETNAKYYVGKFSILQINY
jgi:hypothetical protein